MYRQTILSDNDFVITKTSYEVCAQECSNNADNCTGFLYAVRIHSCYLEFSDFGDIITSGHTYHRVFRRKYGSIFYIRYNQLITAVAIVI